MRTRAYLYIVLGVLILAGLLAVDLVAYSYRAMQGPTLQFARTLIQGFAMLWFVRGAERLFFNKSKVLTRPEEAIDAVSTPVRLTRRFAYLLSGTILSAVLPTVLNIQVATANHIPAHFPALLTTQLLGVLWLMVVVALVMSFWQLTFLIQESRTASRRFRYWAISVAGFSTIEVVSHEINWGSNLLPLTLAISLGIVAVMASIMLGYRLPWMPLVPRSGKRKLLLYSAFNVALSIFAFAIFSSDDITRYLFEYYAFFWHTALSGILGTLIIYFLLVFFSALFSISSTELVERKTAEVKSLAKLTRFSSDVVSSELLLDLPKLADQLTVLAHESTHSDCAWLELRPNILSGDPAHMEEPIHSYVNMSPKLAEMIMSSSEGFSDGNRIGDSPRAELEKTGKPFIRKRKSSFRDFLNPSTSADARTRELSSMAVVPLMHKQEVRGGLYLAKYSEDGYDPDNLTAFSTYAEIASIALEAARLVADSIEKQKFDGELRAARVMQKSLLPEHFPTIPGFDVFAVSNPAYDVGGDYYDFSALKDGAPLVAIGDVSGKGISASLYMAETKGVVQALAPIMSELSDLLEATNGALLRNSPTRSSLRRSFVTLGLLSFHRNSVKYCRAGHTPLLHLRADGSYEFLQPRGMAVGLMKQSLFAETLDEVEIRPEVGDILVLFSDGITDARDSTGDDLGYKRLAEFVIAHMHEPSAKTITDHVLDHVARFTETGTFGDDATLVIMKCIAHQDEQQLDF